MDSFLPPNLTAGSIFQAGYDVTIFGSEPVGETDLMASLDFSTLSIDCFDGKFWHNNELKKIKFNRYFQLTEEQIVKYGMLWLAELITGEMVSSFWFSEWTLLLALQVKSPHNSAIPLFSDFFTNHSQANLSILLTYDVKIHNLMRGGIGVTTEQQFIDWLINKAALRRPNYDWCTFFASYIALSNNQKTIFVPLLAMLAFRYCSLEKSQGAMPLDLYAELPLVHLDAFPPANVASRDAIRRAFTFESPYLGSILVPVLAVHLRLSKTRNTDPVHAKIASLLEYAIMMPFRFKGLYTIKSYIAACDALNCYDGSILKAAVAYGQQKDANFFDELCSEFCVLDEFHAVYANNDPNRSAYPWSRCLEMKYLEHFDSERNPWICTLMTAFAYDAGDEIWKRKEVLKNHPRLGEIAYGIINEIKTLWKQSQ